MLHALWPRQPGSVCGRPRDPVHWPQRILHSTKVGCLADYDNSPARGEAPGNNASSKESIRLIIGLPGHRSAINAGTT
jgi:hypothetical protein